MGIGFGRLFRNVRDKIYSASSKVYNGLTYVKESLNPVLGIGVATELLPLETTNTVVYHSGNVQHYDYAGCGTERAPLNLTGKLERTLREAIDNKKKVEITFGVEDTPFTRTMKKERGRKYLEDPDYGVVRRIDWHTGEVNHLERVRTLSMSRENFKKRFNKMMAFDGRNYHVWETGEIDNIGHKILMVMTHEDYLANYRKEILGL